MKKYKVIQSGYKSIEGELNKNISSLNDAKLESMNVVGDLMVATISYEKIEKPEAKEEPKVKPNSNLDKTKTKTKTK